jgi:predicted secreted protein
MPNLTLLSILALTVSVGFLAFTVSKMINDRNDEILTGVVKGIPVSTKYRWLMLFTNWLPFVVFLIGFLIVTALGALELSRGTDDARVTVLGYMCAVLMGGGAAFWSILSVFVTFPNMASALRDTSRT